MALLDSLISHWTMDDDAANTTVVDIHGSHDGTFIDATGDPNTDAHTAPGIINTSLDFDAVDDIIRIASSNGVGHDFDFTAGPFTLACWVNSDITDGTLISKRDGTDDQFQMFKNDEGGDGESHLNFRAGGATGRGTVILAENTDYYLAVVVGSDEIAVLYVNGVVDTNSKSDAYTFTHRDVDVSIGARWETDPTTAFQHDGQIDEVSIWGRALSADEIIFLYNNGNGVSYPFDAGGKGYSDAFVQT